MATRFARLTREAVRKLKPGQAANEHGIRAERLANGDIKWSVNIMVDGQRVHRAVGTEAGGTTRFQAEQLVEKIKTDARADRLGLPKRRKIPLTFAQAVAAYLGWLEDHNGKNIRVKQLHFRRHLLEAFKTKRLGEIVDLDLERYKRARRNAGAAPATVNRELSSLGHLFTVALKQGWVERALPRPQKFPENNGRIVVLSETELERLIKAAIAGPDPDLWLFVEIGRATGMRHGEILRIRWEHVDLTSRRIFVPQAKAGSRMQPITETLANILKQEQAMRTDQQGWLFPARHKDNRSGHVSHLTRQFQAAVIAAGLDPRVVTPHVLRHTACTRVVEAGADLPTLMRISGHKSIKMALRYTHISDPHIDAAIKALG
jgi:integrase